MLVQLSHGSMVAALSQVPEPSTPLGPFEDSVVAWASWITVMGFVGLVVLALLAGPVARRVGPDLVGTTTARLARVAFGFGALAVPAVLTDIAHDAAGDSGGYDYGASRDALFDGSTGGLLLGLEVVLIALGALLVLPLAARGVAGGARRTWLLAAGLVAGGVALGTTKFPDEVPEDWGRDSFDTVMWMLHLFGGAIWIGGLIGLLVLAVRPSVPVAERGAFWSSLIRRFSVTAMSCVGAITLSGLWLYWEHVDGPSQLFSTMYGRVLGVKILIVGTMALLGMVNQFWLHPRIEALRAAGDTRSLPTVLAREFPVAIAAEVLLGLTVLMVAPFLHGSARNQAFQAEAARTAPAGTSELPRIEPKEVSTSTWIWGTAETVAVIVVMAGGYRVSGSIARRRSRNLAGHRPDPDLVSVV